MSNREAKAQRKMAKKYSTSTTDSYDESSRTITDEEAHRNVSYELPSKLRQIRECFFIQMKRYTRQKAMWFAVVLLVLIPILFLLFENVDSLEGMLPTTEVTNIYIVSLLVFMPTVTPLLACMSCGSMLSQEFNERTVYLSLPLPMSRNAFYIGKFLAALALVEGVVIAAYGICMVLAMTVTERTYTVEIAKSMIVMMAYVFFCCAVTYTLSTKMRRGSTMLPFILLFLVLPIAGICLGFFGKTDMAVTVASYFPCFAPETAMLSLGNTTPISVWGIARMMFMSLTFNPGSSSIAMTLVPVGIGLVLLYLGSRVIKRRDM